MTTNLKLEQFGLVALKQEEMLEVDGGNTLSFPKGLTIWGALGFVATNWRDIKKGLVEGWNAGEF